MEQARHRVVDRAAVRVVARVAGEWAAGKPVVPVGIASALVAGIALLIWPDNRAPRSPARSAVT